MAEKNISNKKNTIYIVIGATILTLARTLKLGGLNTGLLCGLFTGSFYLFSEWFDFVVKEKKGTTLDYWKLKKNDIDKYIRNNVKNYDIQKWYKSPRYWLLVLLALSLFSSLFIVEAEYLSYYIILSLTICLTLIPIFMKGSLLLLIGLSLFKILDVCLMIGYTLSGLQSYLSLTMFFMWTLVWAGLLYISTRIELERRKQTLNKRNKSSTLKCFITSFCFFIFGAVVSSFFYPYSYEDRINFKSNIYAVCEENIYSDLLKLDDTEKSQIDQERLVQITNEYCGCVANEMYDAIDWDTNRFKEYQDLDMHNSAQADMLTGYVYSQKKELCSQRLFENE